MKKLFLLALMSLFGLFAFAQKPLTEKEKIDRLILYIENLKDCQFVRNGTAYPPKEAAEHLRLKWRKGGSDKMTARQFIDQLASSSSMSGKPYQIKWKDGKYYIVKPFLDRELERIEKVGNK